MEKQAYIENEDWRIFVGKNNRIEISQFPPEINALKLGHKFITYAKQNCEKEIIDQFRHFFSKRNKETKQIKMETVINNLTKTKSYTMNCKRGQMKHFADATFFLFYFWTDK